MNRSSAATGIFYVLERNDSEPDPSQPKSSGRAGIAVPVSDGSIMRYVVVLPFRRLREIFNEKFARKTLRRYRKKGLDPIERGMVESVAVAERNGGRVLEIGGGIGAIQAELIVAGADRGESSSCSRPTNRMRGKSRATSTSKIGRRFAWPTCSKSRTRSRQQQRRGAQPRGVLQRRTACG